MTPLVSVITPTWQRHDWLISRCIGSVQKQTYPNIEQIVVNDGPDPELARKLIAESPAWRVPVLFDQLPTHSGEKWGTRGRRRGLELAKGEFIAYLDDDDAYRPEHCEVLAAVLATHPEAGFAYTQMASHGVGDPVAIGSYTLSAYSIGTPMLMHRRELLDLATWGKPDSMEDWNLVSRWLQFGIESRFVPQVTVDVWPSAYRGGTG